jgi:hypothetical protein
MNRIHKLVGITAIGIGLSTCVGTLQAEEFKPVFGSEDETLRPLPLDALSAVRTHAKTTDYRDCAGGGFVGSAVDLTGQGRANGWIAKSADGCAWGAASVVIWVVKRERNTYRVVLYSGGQVVSLKRAIPGTVSDLQIVSQTAGHYARTDYQYDGKMYKELKSRFVNLSDPSDCKRNRDVCDAY